MPGEITESTAIDWGAIERGNAREMANTMWFLFALIKQEALRRDQAIRDRAQHVRQDRVAMIGVYGA
jgi:hypothetical protein